MKKYKHVSFDLDGTLVHTLPAYRHRIVPAAVEHLGGKIKRARDIDRFWFEAGRNRIIEDHFGLSANDFWEVFRRLDSPEERAAHTFAYEDAEDCLKKLKEAGKITSIITGAPEKIAWLEKEKLNDAPIDFYFPLDYSRFGEKPDPRGLLFVLEELGVEAAETIYIGNSNEDALFARNAGVDFIYLERRQHEFDSDDWVDRKIHSLSELFV